MTEYVCNACNGRKFIDYFQFVFHLNAKGHHEKSLTYLQNNNNSPIDILTKNDNPISRIEEKLNKLIKNPEIINIEEEVLSEDILTFYPDLSSFNPVGKHREIARVLKNKFYKLENIERKIYKYRIGKNIIYDYNGYYLTRFYKDIIEVIPEEYKREYVKILLVNDQKDQDKIMHYFNSF